MLKYYESGNFDSKTKIILFHGFGADAQDLLPLGEIIDPNKHWLFPDGPIDIPIGFAAMGRAWWKIDMNRISSSDYDFTQEKPQGLEQVFSAVQKFILSLKTPISDIVLGGFSQGGMMALHAYLNLKEKPKGLILLSSALINKAEQLKKIADRGSGSFYLSHGVHDQVLPYKCGQQLETFLTQAGMKGKLNSFSGSHEIPMSVINQLKTYLTQLEGS
jgi:phospholipase/carboxylesterase